MHTADIREIGKKYAAQFDNLGDVSTPEILFDPRFGKLMEDALKTGVPLTRSAVDAAIHGIAWEY